MKSVLISIRPKWCELIANGKKTIEVRKTRPKCDTPFKCYIYCTKPKMPVRDNGSILMFEDDLAITNRFGQGKRVENPCGAMMEGELFLNGKVIGEFVCDEIYDCRDINMDDTRITVAEWLKYTKGHKGKVYGWHISDLVIYDKPKELSEFYKYCGDNPDCNGCEAHYYSNTECGLEDYCCSKIDGCRPIKRPPQSWCYVEKI